MKKDLILFILLNVIVAIISNSNESPILDSRYILDLPHCKIPEVPLFNEAISPEWNVKFNTSAFCPKEQEISPLSDDGELILLSQSSDCCYTEIQRPNEMPNDTYILSKCRQFPDDTNKVNVSDLEFLVVKCGKGKNEKLQFHSQIPLKSRIQNKLKYWENFPPEIEKPFSVMFLVLDAVQRQHAQRSLPKTIKFMEEEMNFIDFKGHHSLGSSTFTNLIPIMVGTDLDDLRVERPIKENEKFDNVPFIWTNFSDANYVTLHIEDCPTYHTFHFDNRTGFIEQPMDFYTRPYFMAQQKLNKKSKVYLQLRHWIYKPFYYNAFACVEDNIIYKYITDYTLKFLNKFSPSKIPTFSINWLVWPHHDYLAALKTLDNMLLDVMQNISKSPDIYENTIIVFLGDHGFKYANYSDTMEGLQERNMALLKIRLPKRFEQNYPKYAHNMKVNSARRVTSHVDLFKTLATVHQIALEIERSANPNLMPEKVQKIRYGYNKSYGYSLFNEIPKNRTCADAMVPIKFCGCNFPLYSEKFDYQKYKKPH